jgi:hypothetical protein
MKKQLLTFCFALFAITMFANNAQLFSFDQNSLENQFAELSVLENTVLQNPAIDFNNAMQMSLIANNFFAANHFSSKQKNMVFEWEGFLWGFLCCPIGFFVVAVNSNKTKDNKTSYWIGVGASVVLSAITYKPVYNVFYY